MRAAEQFLCVVSVFDGTGCGVSDILRHTCVGLSTRRIWQGRKLFIKHHREGGGGGGKQFVKKVFWDKKLSRR